jgi:hypothetical protein
VLSSLKFKGFEDEKLCRITARGLFIYNTA